MSFNPSFNAMPASQPGQRRRTRARPTTVKDGKIVAKFFNAVAARPYPPIGSLHDTITVQMTSNTPAFLTVSTVVPTYSSVVFTVGALSGSANYLALFDQYRLDQLEVWFEPASAPAANISYPELATAVDLDDGNAPTSFGQVADHPGAMVGQGINGRYHKWKPHIASAVYSGAFTSFANQPASWIDSASPNVQHYGFKVASTIASSAVQYNLAIRAKVSFRAPGIN